MRRSSIALVCLLMAANLVAVSFLPHTDDGCPTEIHCVVCLTHLAGLAIQVSVPSITTAASIDIAPPDSTPSVGETGTPSTLVLRGPPPA